MAWADRGGGKVLIQWATSTASDWVEYTFTNMSQVRATPKKPEPGDSPVIDDQPGWLAAINIQGVVLTGDHVGFNIDGSGRLVAGKWNDDPADWPFPWGALYTFDSIAPDPAFPVTAEFAAANPSVCGQTTLGVWCLLNTRQTAVPYIDIAGAQAAIASDPVEYVWAQRMLDDPAVMDFGDWPRFNNNVTIHGVWMNETLWAEQTAARSIRGWEEWR